MHTHKPKAPHKSHRFECVICARSQINLHAARLATASGAMIIGIGTDQPHIAMFAKPVVSVVAVLTAV